MYLCLDFSLDLAEMSTCLWHGSDHFLHGPLNNPLGPQQEPRGGTLHYFFLQVLFYSFKCRAKWWVRVPGQRFLSRGLPTCVLSYQMKECSDCNICASQTLTPLPFMEARSVSSNPATAWPAHLCPATTTGLSHCRTPTTALSFQMC